MGPLAEKVNNAGKGNITRFVVHEKDDDLKASLLQFLDLVKRDLPAKPRIGMIKDTDAKGKFYDAVEQAMKEKLEDATLFDIKGMASSILSVRRLQDEQFFQKSAKYLVACCKYISKSLEEELLVKRTVTNDEFSQELSKQLEKAQLKMCRELDMDIEFTTEIAAPLVQSGGDYSFKMTAVSSNQRLSFDSVVVSYGVGYYDFKTLSTRTYLFGSQQSDEDDYKLM